jgi:hypothetical protein
MGQRFWEANMSTEEKPPEINWDTADGAAWASEDDDICRQYAGKWLVALPGRIIAFGDDIDQVGAEASKILGVPPSTIIIRSIVHPDEWFKDYPHCNDTQPVQSGRCDSEELAVNEVDEQVNLNWDTVDGGTWASEDEEISRSYAGKWVVALPGRIIAAGNDLQSVRAEAAQVLKLDPASIVPQAITHPDEWFKDYPISAELSTSQSAG